MKTFEKPLSAKEEAEYLERYRNGDEKAGEILIIRNMRLVAHMVKHYALSDKDVSEMISIGTIGLIKAVKTFNLQKGSRLATYAAKCIDNELLMAFRSDKKKSREVSLQEPIGTDKEGNEISIIDVIETDEKNFIDAYILKCDIQKLYEGIDKVLTSREREIIVRRYGLFQHKEATQRELADEMHISRSYISRIEKKAIQKLRSCFDS
ncbi:MAG: RNA polymerase sporulation sigma factor SigK [Butyrivibrio sp.]